MKIALVGVGPWGSLLARKLTEAGAHIAFHVRQQGPDVAGFGQRLDVSQLWEPGRVDGLVLAAPPELTLSLATQAAQAGLAVLATKPLRLSQPLPIAAPFFVDYVRLWARCYGLLKARLAGHALSHIGVQFWGQGPWRTFSSLEDYGPHALAFVHDLLGSDAVLHDVQATPVRHFERGATMHAASARVGATAVSVEVGNGAPSRRLRLSVRAEGLGELVYEEQGMAASLSLNGETLVSEQQDPLAAMSAEFLAHQAQGLADERFVRLSVAVTRSLRQIGEAEARACSH